MDSKRSDDVVHHKYSREELMAMSKLELSLKKPDLLKEECFNENKRWSPELGFRVMVLENKNSNGSSGIKVDSLKSEPGLPALRPQLGLWGKGCQPVNGISSQVKLDQPVSVDLSPVRPATNNSRPPPKIIIPPRPQEDRHTELSTSWRDRRFEQEKRPWNEKPAVSARRPEFNDRFDPRFDRRDYRDHRYPSDRRYQGNGHGRPEEEDPDWDGGWDDPDENNPFEFGEHTELPGHKTEQMKAPSNPHSPDPPERPSSATGKRSSIPKSESPDMESRMMSELLKIFDDNEVTEIPVVTDPGGSRILGLIHQQDHHQQDHYHQQDHRYQHDHHHQQNYQQQPPNTSFADQMMRQPNVHSNSGDPFRQQSFPPISRPSPGPVSSPFSAHGQVQQGQSDGIGNDLLQILQKAKINVNNLVPNSNYSGVPSLNVAQAKSLAEIEGGLAASRASGALGQSSPKSEPSENHAFNKLLEMINSSRSRTENNHLGQQHFSSHELEKMHDERKRMEQLQQEIRRDSIGSGTPRSFVPIQVMRQARSHLQEQVPSRPVIGRTSSGGAPAPFPGQGQPQFGPRMGMNEAEMRHMAQFRPGGPAVPIRGQVGGLGRNSPVNLLNHQQSQQQFMMSQQLRGGPFGPINQPPLHPFGPGGMGQPSQQMLVGGPRGGMPIPSHHLQSRPPGQQQPMNLQQLQMLNQHLHSLPPQQLNDMPRGLTSEQLNQMLLRASHQ